MFVPLLTPPILNLSIVLMVITGLFSLGLNFATTDSSDSYRNALFVMFAANITGAALVYFGLPVAFGLFTSLGSLCVAIFVTSRDRIKAYDADIKRKIMRSKSFKRALYLGAVTVVVTLVAVGTGPHVYTPTPIEDAADSVSAPLPTHSELKDLATLDSLNALHP